MPSADGLKSAGQQAGSASESHQQQASTPSTAQDAQLVVDNGLAEEHKRKRVDSGSNLEAHAGKEQHIGDLTEPLLRSFLGETM